jgi:3-phenylpropionate/trans-cinnamate dioxygenase ferredoxin subunit
MSVYTIINLEVFRETTKLDSIDGFIPVLEEKELQEGTMKRLSIEGTPVLLVKQQGKIFALDNRCPHQGCSLSNGSLDGLVIVCPCHDWRFNLERGEYEDDSSLKLVSFLWKVEAGKIWVKLNEDTDS